jgi:outer membrane protein OmpA-like peptidoglycan-associated protein
MKKITLLFLAIVFAVGAVMAQNSDKKWAIGLGPGIDFNLDSNEKNALLDLYFSRYLNPSFDLMLDTRMGFYGPNLEKFFFGDGIDLVNPLLNIRYKLNNGYIFKEKSAIQPYLFGGVGYMWDNQADGVNFDGGIGFKVPIGKSKSTALFVAASYVKGIEAERMVPATPKGAEPVKYTEDHFQITSIIEFGLGSKDTDGDGVKDKRDECPNTPAGVAVDEKGCCLDRDGDGIPDYKDDCPDEAGDAKFNGCPDRDGDGIMDKEDDCPDVAGLAKFKGCPDTDEDGVPDKIDQCPNTPKGCPVDAVGCPLDSDGDGVIDCEDKCPTEKGPASNNGCPDWVEIQISALHFDFDKSELRPEGKAELDKLASQLNASKEYDIVVGGHTDSIGTEEYNMKLSERRAQAVVKYLLMKGVNNAYVGSNNYGESKPLVDNKTKENRQKNRRAEFEVAKVRK